MSYFVRVADDGSLTKASGVLGVAQPALSRQMKLLEHELGVALFKRTTYGMQLTEEGEYLRASVAVHLRAIDLALRNVRSFKSQIEGTFAIGMPTGILDRIAIPLIDRMATSFPNIRLRIIESRTGSLVDILNRGIIDFAVVENGSRDDRLKDTVLCAETLLLVGANGTGLNAAGSMSFTEAAHLPLILPLHHLGARSQINEAASKLRLTLNVQHEADAARFVFEMVATGKGFTMLPASQISHAKREQVEVCAITEPALPITTYFCTRKNSVAVNGQIEQTVFDMILEILAEQGD
ncbi:MAG: LysR family transcriptional regulator [Sphingobium sp.]